MHKERKKMSMYPIVEDNKSLEIFYIDDPTEYPDVLDICLEIAERSNIRISPNKKMTFVAALGDWPIIGTAWTSFERGGMVNGEYNDNMYFYDVDITVDPNYRSLMAGPKLINSVVRHYNTIGSQVRESCIRVFVVNERLAGLLQRKYGLMPEHGIWSRNSPRMVRYGTM